MMTCILIEDELPAQKVLINFINKIVNIKLLQTFQTATNAKQFIQNNSIDIVFLDINLPVISGLEFIKIIENPPLLIITTAYPDYAVSSFELPTIVDYLVKPISFKRFEKAILKAQNFIVKEESSSKTLFLNVDKTLHKIVVEDILYIESERNYITIVTKNQKFSFIDTLKNWIDKLPFNQFIQTHKSFLINQQSIKKIVGNTLFIDTYKIPIGRKYKPLLFEKLKIK